MATLSRHELSDGTFLIFHRGDNMHKNHWHIASDGTVLSIKNDGDHKYNRGQVRQDIRKVLPEFFSGDNAWTVGWKPGD